MIKKSTEAAAKHALKAVAKKNGVSVETVQREIEIAVAAARADTSSDVQSFWKSVPGKGNDPTLEEIIAYLAQRCNQVY